MRGQHRTPGMAAIDFTTAIFFMFFFLFAIVLVLVVSQQKTKPTITTLGVYAVTVQWKDSSNDDVDTYVQDPNGGTVFFASPSVNLMNLEHDQLGTARSAIAGGKATYLQNQERVVLRGTVAGEYIVNVHMYSQVSIGPQQIKVTLWRLAGDDKQIMTKTVTMNGDGDQKTVWRLVLNNNGYITGKNDLQKDLVNYTGERQYNVNTGPGIGR